MKPVECFFKSPMLPFVECRHTRNSGEHYRAHSHTTLSIGAITEGAVSFESDGAESRLIPGTLIVINPEVVHACNPVEHEARSYHMLYLDPAWCQGVQSALFGTDEPFLPVSRTLIDRRDLYEGYLGVCKTLLESEAGHLIKEETLQAFVEELFGSYCTPQASPTSIHLPERRRIETARNFMQEHLSSDLTIAQIAAVSGISPAYFSRSFKAATGHTPHRYLLNLRIERARELLATDMPIARIALEVGFTDQSHLNRVFTPIVACTPGEYRRGLVRRG
jgi:AraC-like DNA-binding protein